MLKKDKAALVAQVGELEATSSTAATTVLLNTSSLASRPSCDATGNIGQQVMVFVDKTKTWSELALCVGTPSGSRWKTLASPLLDGLAIGSTSGVGGGIPGGTYHLFGDARHEYNFFYTTENLKFVGYPTGGQVPVITATHKVDVRANLETDGCFLDTENLVTSGNAQRVELSLNNPAPKAGFKQALLIEKVLTQTMNAYVLEPGKYQMDVDVPTGVSFVVTGKVELVGGNVLQPTLFRAKKIHVMNGGQLITSNIHGIQSIEVAKDSTASIGIPNVNPDTSLLQSLEFKCTVDNGGANWNTVLQPGNYQVDSRVDLGGKWRVLGAVNLIGSEGGSGSLKHAKIEVNSDGYLKASHIAFGSAVGDPVINLFTAVGKAGRADITSCMFEDSRDNGHSIHIQGSYSQTPGIPIAVVTDSVFRNNHGSPLFIYGAGSITCNNCNIYGNFGGCEIDFGTSNAGYTERRSQSKMAFNGGTIRDNFSTSSSRPYLYASYGTITATGVKFENNQPVSCGNSESSGGGTVTGC